VTQGVAHIKELVHNFVADIARQSPAEIFTDQARDASAPYPPRADVEYCVTLFSPPTDLWEELALDYIKELYVETVTFFFFLCLSLINHRYFYRITELKEKSFLFYKRFDGWLPMSRAYHIIPDIFNNKTLYILR
jgi:hypothetical protein